MSGKKILAYVSALLIVALVSAAFLRPGDDGSAPSDAAMPSDSGYAETRYEGVVYDGSGSIELDGEVVSTIVDGVDIMSNDFYPSVDMTPLNYRQLHLRAYPSVPLASLDVEPPPPEPSNDWGITCTLTDLTAGGATMIVFQTGGEALTGESLSTGETYTVEYWDGEAWQRQPNIPSEVNWGFFAIGRIVTKEGSSRFGMHWSASKGLLTPGYYRVGKDISDFREPGDYDDRNFYAQFVVLEDGTATTALPENRFGTAELSDGDVGSLEELVYEADAIAHVRVTSWLGDVESENATLFSVELRETLKGTLDDDFVLVQEGTSANPCADFPLFAAGNDLLVFLEEVPAEDTELRSRGRSYRMVGSCRSLFYVGVTEDWEVVAAPHPLGELGGYGKIGIAPAESFSDRDAFISAAASRDPEFWASEAEKFEHSEDNEYYMFYFTDLREKINYCIANPPYTGETVEVYQPLPDIEDDFGGLETDIVTKSRLIEEIESSGDTDLFEVTAVWSGCTDFTGEVRFRSLIHKSGNWAMWAYPEEVERPDGVEGEEYAAGVIEKLDESGEWRYYDDLVVDTNYDEGYPYEKLWGSGSGSAVEYFRAQLPITDPGEYRITYHLRKMKSGGGVEDETYTVSHGYTVPEASGKRFDLLNVFVDTGYSFGPYVNFNIRANDGTLPYLDPQSIVLEQWLGGNWTRLDTEGSSIRRCIHREDYPMVADYVPAATPPHEAMGYEVFFNIGTADELYRMTAEFSENPDGSGERYTLQFKFDTSSVDEDF